MFNLNPLIQQIQAFQQEQIRTNQLLREVLHQLKTQK